MFLLKVDHCIDNIPPFSQILYSLSLLLQPQYGLIHNIIMYPKGHGQLSCEINERIDVYYKREITSSSVKSVSCILNTLLHCGASSNILSNWFQSIAVGNTIMCLYTYYFGKVMSYYYSQSYWKVCLYILKSDLLRKTHSWWTVNIKKLSGPRSSSVQVMVSDNWWAILPATTGQTHLLFLLLSRKLHAAYVHWRCI